MYVYIPPWTQQIPLKIPSKKPTPEGLCIGPGHVLDVSLGDQAHEATTHTTWGPTIGGNPMEKQWLMMISDGWLTMVNDGSRWLMINNS